nr:MAG TPA: hypothetical protein [Caudoviricetes sp.]
MLNFKIPPRCRRTLQMSIIYVTWMICLFPIKKKILH